MMSITGPTPIIVGLATIVVVLALVAVGLQALQSSQVNRMKLRCEEAIQAGLANYEVIVNGVLYIGKDAKTLATNCTDLSFDGSSVTKCEEHICRAKNGAYFIFHAEASNGAVVDMFITPCSEEEIKHRLEPHVQVYIDNFGRPDEA